MKYVLVLVSGSPIAVGCRPNNTVFEDGQSLPLDHETTLWHDERKKRKEKKRKEKKRKKGKKRYPKPGRGAYSLALGVFSLFCSAPTRKEGGGRQEVVLQQFSNKASLTNHRRPST